MKSSKLVGVPFLCVCGDALASTGDSTYTDIANLIEQWSSGSLGKILAGEALVTGLAYGIIRQNFYAIIISISAALVLTYGPDVLTSFFSITV